MNIIFKYESEIAHLKNKEDYYFIYNDWNTGKEGTASINNKRINLYLKDRQGRSYGNYLYLGLNEIKDICNNLKIKNIVFNRSFLYNINKDIINFFIPTLEGIFEGKDMNIFITKGIYND